MREKDDRSNRAFTSPPGQSSVEPDDEFLLKNIRTGDDASFAKLVARYERSMIRVARAYVKDQALAEEVVQESWLAVIKGVRGFKHHSSLKTWLFRILVNQAKKRAARETRESPDSVSYVGAAEVSSNSFDASGEWRFETPSWDLTPEAELLSKEAAEHIRRAIDCLPFKQRVVITMRDLEGWTSDEVCLLMQITSTNQRVLLHLARTKLEQMLDSYFSERRKAPASRETEGPKQ
jgi:RNA polymerase sigma-70 factor (ECF subfamily)